MITFGADVTNPAGEKMRMAFNADSEAAARDYVQQGGLTLTHLYEIRRSTVAPAQVLPKSVTVFARPPDRSGGMLTFGADVTNPAGEKMRMAFNAESETIARDYIRIRGFTLKRLYEIQRPTPLSTAAVIPARYRRQRERVSAQIGPSEIHITSPIQKTMFVNIHHFVGEHDRALGDFCAGSTVIGMVLLFMTLPGIVEAHHLPWWWIMTVGAWIVLEILSFYILFVSTFGTERIDISSEGLRLGIYLGRFGNAKTYPLGSLDHVQRQTYAGYANRLVFSNQGRKIPLGRYMALSDANVVETYLHEIVQTGCHTVTHIHFAKAASSSSTSNHIINPNVSTLQFPFVCLQQLVIDADTYDIYQFDQFLTYAVNVIGAEVLRKHVDAHIYGQSAKLHPNHRNNLTQLCRQVIFHDAAYGEYAPDAATVV